jgi:hypothetical protein
MAQPAHALLIPHLVGSATSLKLSEDRVFRTDVLVCSKLTRHRSSTTAMLGLTRVAMTAAVRHIVLATRNGQFQPKWVAR